MPSILTPMEKSCGKKQIGKGGRIGGVQWGLATDGRAV